MDHEFITYTSDRELGCFLYKNFEFFVVPHLVRTTEIKKKFIFLPILWKSWRFNNTLYRDERRTQTGRFRVKSEEMKGERRKVCVDGSWESNDTTRKDWISTVYVTREMDLTPNTKVVIIQGLCSFYFPDRRLDFEPILTLLSYSNIRIYVHPHTPT